MKDVIVVLGLAVNEDGTLPAPARYRVETALELWRDGRARFLLMSGLGPHGTPDDRPISEADAMKSYAVSLGVPADAVLVERKSRDTILNAYYTKRLFLQPRGWKRVIVVTSRYHAERSEYAWKKILGPDYSLKVVPAPDDLSPESRIERDGVEQRFIKDHIGWLGAIEDGDDKAIDAVMTRRNARYRLPPV